MTEPIIDLSNELVVEFIDESLEALGHIDEFIVSLEHAQKSCEIIEAVFRPVHSIKGNSTFFGLTKVKILAHELETLLDLIRKEKRLVDADLVTVLLAGVDELRAIFTRVRSGQPEILDAAAFETLVGKVKAAASGPSPESRWKEILSSLEATMASLPPEATAVRQRLEAILRDIESVVGLKKEGEAAPTPSSPSTLPALETLRSLLQHPISNIHDKALHREVGDHLRSLKEASASDETKNLVAEMIDTFETMVGAVGLDDLVRDILREKLEQLTQKGSWKAAVERVPSPSAPPPAPLPAAPPPESKAKDEKKEKGEKAEKSAVEPQKTMRVSESHIDTFLHYVGELVVVNDMFLRLYQDMEATNIAPTILERFRHANETFDALSGKLQESIMSIRLVPMRMLFQKVPRLVRDVAKIAGKEVEVVIEGEEIQIDKSLLDLLDAPLTHILRNAVDHGIEKPEIREERGKPRKGTVTVIASEDEDNISLLIKDDGAGLNKEKIRAKAISMGLLDPAKELTEEMLVDLIFASGLSTAEKVTDISGRGVGMDVVKHMVQEVGGDIRVLTHRGQGTQFRILLPKAVTTKIMRGYLVEVDQQAYVLPLEAIAETLQITEDAIRSSMEEDDFFLFHGEPIPLLSFRSILRKEVSKIPPQPTQIVVVLASKKVTFGVVVDSVIGVRQVVLKEIVWPGISSQTIAGGALMGDGTVALIVDLDAISVQLARRHPSRP